MSVSSVDDILTAAVVRQPLVQPQRPNMGLDIVIASAGMAHHGGTLAERSLGGSETAAIMVAKALAAHREHHVTMFTPGHTGGVWDHVTYRPIEEFTSYAAGTPHDVTIVSRIPDLCRVTARSSIKILWCHDLALKRYRGALGSVLWNLQHVYLLSDFMRQQYEQVHDGVPASLYRVTRNGIDRGQFVALQGLPRDRTKLVYGSRPERGLEQALAVMERLHARGSKLVLHVSSYDNTPEQLVPFYQACFQKAQSLPNVKWLGSLKQADWHKELATARAWLYPGVPSDFREISPVHGDTLIETVQGPKPIRELVGQSGFHVYSRTPEGRLGISKVRGVFRTRENADVLTLRFRVGSGRNARKESALTLTPDHEVMLLDGTYKPAGELRIGDRVMAWTRQAGKYAYARVGLTGQSVRDAHRVVMESVLGRTLSPVEVVHHKDGNERNNDPSNLMVVSHREHRRLHWAEKPPGQRTDEVARRAETLRAFLATPEGREVWSRASNERWSRRAKLIYVFECAECGKAVERTAKPRGKKVYCSPTCNLKVAQQYRWGKVASNHVVVGIETAPPADVYCMTVEPDHNFVANGIVVHNCISAMEAQACGTPVVSCAKGALPETLGASVGMTDPPLWTTDVGYIIGTEQSDCGSAAHLEQVVDACLRMEEDDAGWARMSAACKARAKGLGWDGVATQWLDWWQAELRERSSDPWRMARHVWRTGDRELLTEQTRRLEAGLDAEAARE